VRYRARSELVERTKTGGLREFQTGWNVSLGNSEHPDEPVNKEARVGSSSNAVGVGIDVTARENRARY
jgi:hypothetical protein